MSENFLKKHFDLSGQVAVVTGGSGVLGGAMALGLAQAGARVAILARREELAAQAVANISEAGGEGLFVVADVLNRAQLEAACATILERWGRIDILVNAAGGNMPAAVIGEDASVFDMPQEAFEQVVSLNLTGTLLPTQVFGKAMVERSDGAKGCIINISSMAAIRAISRVVGYSVAKASIDNLTRWLAVELARKYGAGLRVNAIAPGFFIGEQNRRLLTNPDNSLTTRGQKIIEHTPAGRFGEPDELVSTLLFLCAPGSTFVNGVVIPVDGGFNIFSGV
jgi:NAD(P)-dependent dehydrogenase (short-subunit alcohol dehydrogenase family)